MAEAEDHIHNEHDFIDTMRHSTAHVMAETMLKMFPDAKIGMGPNIENGFYYDFDLPRPLRPEDLQEIEDRMREIVKADEKFSYEEIDKEKALELFRSQPYKSELIRGIPDEKVRVYTQGSFTDLCRGPHLSSTGHIKAFKLLTIAGAYWRGDETRPMLQRIYGTAFETEEELQEHLKQLEEAAQRDHRKLGRELDLFFMDPIAPGSPFFLPKGAIVYNLMIDFMRDMYRRYNYQEVVTPQIFSAELWKRSGHYDNYKENMYFLEIEEREFGVKPMNCPGHCVMFKSKLHSYRELPIRYADFGRLNRYERSGVLHGLTRVRSFSQDDAHIYCRPEQVESEIASLIQMMREAYDAFGLNEPRFTLSLRPQKRMGGEELWDGAEGSLRGALRSCGVPFDEVPGEGAFYGPKIDLFTSDALNREWQLCTYQLDFNLPERFDLEYVAEDGSYQRPLMIHRAILGSIERFFGILLEHHAGAFPVWLAPVQAVVIPIADRHIEYAQQIEKVLKEANIRTTVDDRSERMNYKIREHQAQKVPYMLVVGDKEAASEEQLVTVRNRSGSQEQMPAGEFVQAIVQKVQEKSLEL